jgi:hypothetical protein
VALGFAIRFESGEQPAERGVRPEQDRRLRSVTASDGRIELELDTAADVRVILYRLTRLYRARYRAGDRLTPIVHRAAARNSGGNRSPGFDKPVGALVGQREASTSPSRDRRSNPGRSRAGLGAPLPSRAD